MGEQIKILEEMRADYLRKADALDVAIRQLKDKDRKKSVRKNTVKYTEQFPVPEQNCGGIRLDWLLVEKSDDYDRERKRLDCTSIT